MFILEEINPMYLIVKNQEQGRPLLRFRRMILSWDTRLKFSSESIFSNDSLVHKLGSNISSYKIIAQVFIKKVAQEACQEILCKNINSIL